MTHNITQSMESLSTDSVEFKRALKILLKYEIHCLLQRLSDTGEEAIVITTSVDEDIPGHLATAKGEGFLQNEQFVPRLKEQFYRYCTGGDFSPVNHDELEHIGNDDTVVVKREHGDRDASKEVGSQMPGPSPASHHADVNSGMPGPRPPSVHKDITPTPPGRQPPSIHSRDTTTLPAKRQQHASSEASFTRSRRRSVPSRTTTKADMDSDSNSEIQDADDDDGEDAYQDMEDDADDLGRSAPPSGTVNTSARRSDNTGPGHMTVSPGNELKQNESDSIPMDFTWKMEKLKPIMDSYRATSESGIVDGNQNTLQENCDITKGHVLIRKRTNKACEEGKSDCEMSKELLDPGSDAYNRYFQSHDFPKHAFLPQMPPAFSDDLVDFSLRTKKFWHSYFSESNTSLGKDGQAENITHTNDESEVYLSPRRKDFESKSAEFSGSPSQMPKGLSEGSGKTFYDTGSLSSTRVDLLNLSHDTNSDASGSAGSEQDEKNRNEPINFTKRNLTSRSQRAYAKYGVPVYSDPSDSEINMDKSRDDPIDRRSSERFFQDNNELLKLKDGAQNDAKQCDSFETNVNEVYLKSEIKLEPIPSERHTSIERMLENAGAGKFVPLSHGTTPIHLNFSCKVCGQVFKNRQYRDFHVKLHKSSHRYLCSLCSEGFNTESACSIHQREHKEPIFQCESCGYRCTREFRMRAHKEICGSPSKIHVCPYCDKQFAAQRYMRIHMKSHDTKNVHTCPHCQNSYPLKNSLLKHMKKKHTTR